MKTIPESTLTEKWNPFYIINSKMVLMVTDLAPELQVMVQVILLISRG